MKDLAYSHTVQLLISQSNQQGEKIVFSFYFRLISKGWYSHLGEPREMVPNRSMWGGVGKKGKLKSCFFDKNIRPNAVCKTH